MVLTSMHLFCRLWMNSISALHTKAPVGVFILLQKDIRQLHLNLLLLPAKNGNNKNMITYFSFAYRYMYNVPILLSRILLYCHKGRLDGNPFIVVFYLLICCHFLGWFTWWFAIQKNLVFFLPTSWFKYIVGTFVAELVSPTPERVVNRFSIFCILLQKPIRWTTT